MRKIIGIIHPFDLYQTFYVYEDGNKIDMMKTEIDDLSQNLIELAYKYNVTQVDISGAKHYARGLARKTQQKELTQYNKQTLEFNFI